MYKKYAEFKNRINVFYLKIPSIILKLREAVAAILYTTIFLFRSEKVQKFLFLWYTSKVKVSKSSRDLHRDIIISKAGNTPNYRVNLDYDVAAWLRLTKRRLPRGLKVGKKHPTIVKWYNPTKYPPKPDPNIVEKFAYKRIKYSRILIIEILIIF
jgi:hypothetical protein